MGIDAETSSAIRNMKRIVLAAYIPVHGKHFQRCCHGWTIEHRRDALIGPDGKMDEGTGNVILVSSVVFSLRFGYLVAIQ